MCKHSRVKVIPAIVEEAVDCLLPRSHGADVVTLHLEHAVGEVVHGLFDEEEQISCPQRRVRAETNEVIGKAICGHGKVRRGEFFPLLGQGSTASSGDWESRHERCVEASGTHNCIYWVVHSVVGDDACLIDSVDALSDSADLVFRESF